MEMIYRGVKMEPEEKRKGRRDLLKAVGICLGTAAVIAAAVVLSGRLGIR